MQTIDSWLDYVSGGDEISNQIFEILASELPSLASLILDRSCRFQCEHCIFQKEAKFEGLPKESVVLSLLRQLPAPKVVHEGRQLSLRQLPLLKAISRAGYELGIIESGTYTSMIEDIRKSELFFDWMDISIDGPKEVHNLQRSSRVSWDTATRGLRHSRKVVKSGGKVTSLFTVTALNYDQIETTSHWLVDQGIDEWHLTTMSLRSGIEKLRAPEKQLGVFLNQMFKVRNDHNHLFMRIYNLADFLAVANLLGKSAFSKSLQKVEVTQNAIVLDIGFPLLFFPKSLAPGETLVIDADGWWRLPYCVKYTLAELNKGQDFLGQDISVYNVLKPTSETSVSDVYKKAVHRWRGFAGEESLVEERLALQKFL